MQMSQIDLSNIGEWIFDERLKRKWSRIELSDRANVDATLIFRYETEQVKPRVDSFNRILQAFGYELVVRRINNAKSI